jgi:DNA-binding NarL/FixJ family response regulator
MTKVALVDDHALLRNGLASVINNSEGYQVVFEADNGRHFIEMLKTHPKPDILLLDITMPEMDGFETAYWVRNNAPDIKILVLSMMDDDKSIIRMLKYGARGYILKDSKPEVLRSALRDIKERGFFFNELVSGRLVHLAANTDGEKGDGPVLNEKETDFLKLCCTEKSYKEIADAMQITPRAVEALRSNLFEKLHTLSRVGLAMYAIKNGIAKI